MGNGMLARAPWPDAVDASAFLLFAVIFLGGPLLGYWLGVLDLRRYLRALRGALIQVTYYFPGIPRWARRETPASFIALGLGLPCTAEDVKQAYWRMAKELHPDRGGDRRRFFRLQQHCESALEFLGQLDAADLDESESVGFQAHPPGTDRA
ncbi:MAG TPA: J domain-containing protein [Pirellulaceae bacterium]